MTNEKVVIKSLPFRKETDPTFIQIQALNGATNGDMIKAMFPDVKWYLNEDGEVFTDHKTYNSDFIRFSATWWNEPYCRKRR